MSSNYFDQFDEPAIATAAPAQGGGNFFDQFDEPAAGGGRPLTIRPAAQPKSWGDTAADLAQSAATGVEKGAIGALTLPAAIESGLHGFVSRRVIDPLLSVALGSAPQQPAAAPGSLHDIATNTGDYVGVGGVSRGLDALGVPFYQPQTTAGRYAETIGEFAGGGGAGRAGSIAKTAGSLARNVVLPGLASEAAGQATEGTALEPWARAIAPVVTAITGHLVGGPGAPGKVLADAAGGLDGPTLDAAQQLMDAARQQGTPLSLAEAVQQVTNSGTRLGSLQRVVEQSRGGAEPMARFYADRPGQVQRTGNAAIDQIAPVPAVPFDGSMGPTRPNPSDVGPAVQRAAQGALADFPQSRVASQAVADVGPRVSPEQAGQVIQPGLRSVYDQRLDARSTQARADYRAAGSDTVPAESVQAIIDDLGARAAADKTGLLAQHLNALRSRLIDRTARPMELDPTIESPATGSPPPFAPADDYAPRAAPVRPDAPRPQSLQGFVKTLGGIQDARGDLKAMGLDRVPGLIAKPGKGLGPDAVRQIAAEQGYLGADIDSAMSNTDINDLFDALARHPVHSVRDAGTADAWHAYDLGRSEADALGRPLTVSARPPQGPGLPFGGFDEAPASTPITDIENLNRTRKTFRDRIALPATAPKAIDKETAATIGPVLEDLDHVMTEGSPAYARANANFQANSVPLEPFENTPALASTIERDPYGNRFVTPAEQVPGLIDRGGASAARTFNDVAPANAREVYERHIATQLLDKSMGPNGIVDPDRLARMVNENRDTFAQFPNVVRRMQRVIDTQRATEPLRNTMVGRLAAKPEFREQAAVILDPNPIPGSASEVADAVRQIAERNPTAARALVSQRIRQVFNEATQGNATGPNQAGGAKFNAVIRGNNQQARNLKAAVEALHGPGVWRDFQKALDVFEAMGRRQAPGSQTEFNRQLSTELQRGGAVGQAVAAGASPGRWLSKAQDIYDGWRYGRNTEVLADFLTRPDAAKRLAQIAKAPAGSAQSEGMAAMYLLGASTNQAGKREPK